MPHPNIIGLSSGLITASGLVGSVGPKRISAVTIQRGTLTQTHIRIIDSIDGTGVIVWSASGVAGAAVGDITDHYTFSAGLLVGNGIWVNFFGAASAVVIVVYA